MQAGHSVMPSMCPTWWQMGFAFQRSGRVCLVEWKRSVEVGDILGIRSETEATKQACGGPVLLIASISAELGFPSEAVRSAFPDSLSAALTSCSGLLVAIEGTDEHRRMFRSLFALRPSSTPRSLWTEFHVTLDAAFVSARRVAPQEVLQLQLLRIRRPGDAS
jgi:hypothetical protein